MSPPQPSLLFRVFLCSMSILGAHGVKGLLSNSGIRCLLLRQYSTTSATVPSCPQAHFMVDYLINSLGLSRAEAITASTKVTHLKSIERPDLVLDLFKQCGLDKTQIREIVSSVPKLLLCNVDKTLKPKLRVLQELGISGPDLVKIISSNHSLCSRGLNTQILPSIDYLREVLGSDEKVIKALKKSKWLLSFNVPKRFPPNLLLLQKSGFSNEKLEKFIMQNPRYLLQKPEWLEDIIRRVETELGISKNSAMFFHGIHSLASVSKSTIEKKSEIFRSFGWSDSDIITMARNLPFSLSLSEDKIRKGLNFFMKELGYEPAYLASHPKILSYSLQKRVMPRHEVLKILKEKMLLKKKLSLYTAVSYSELSFVKEFVLCHKDEIPDLYEIYTNNMGL